MPLRSSKIAFFISLTLCLLLMANSNVIAQEALDPAFALGLKKYQEGQYDEAVVQLTEALSRNPESSQILYNLGLAQFKKSNVGMAIGMWRKALEGNPSLSEASSAIKFANSQLEKVAPSEGNPEDLLHGYLNQVSIDQILGLTGILLLCGMWTFLRFLGLRRVALRDSLPMPVVPKVTLGVLFLLVISTTLAVLKAIDIVTARATVISKKAEAKTGPGSDNATLFEVFEGANLIVKTYDSGWAQVKTAGGKMGWVSSESLFQTSGKHLW